MALDSSDSGARERSEEPPLKRPGGLFARPWFWFLAIGGLWLVPLLKSIGAELPEPLPGMEGEPLTLSLSSESGGGVSLQDLSGYLLVLRQLPLADLEAANLELNRLHELRGRLRGLGSDVVYVLLAHGGTREQLTAILDARTVRKPVHVFLLDPGQAGWDGLCARARAFAELSPVDPSGEALALDSLLLDRHGRLRGVYSAGEEGVDRLVSDAGQLANWLASDLEPGSFASE